MTHRTKRIVFLSLTFALVALLLLSASLSGLRLQTGTPFPGSADVPGVVNETTPLLGSGSPPLPLLEMIIGVALLCAIVFFLTRLIGLVSLRNIAWVILAVIVLLALFSLLPGIPAGNPRALPDDSSAAATRESRIYPVLPLGKTPSGFIWVTGAGLLIVVSLLAAYSWKRAGEPSRATEALSREAEGALKALAAGTDFSNVIVGFYLQMMDLLRAERNLERQESMTVREFQEWLASNGIPPEPIRDLSFLFEKARYSREKIDDSDEKRGAECLMTIVQFCHDAKARS